MGRLRTVDLLVPTSSDMLLLLILTKYCSVNKNQQQQRLLGQQFTGNIDDAPGNGTAHFENHKQMFEYQNFLILRDIWWSKF